MYLKIREGNLRKKATTKDKKAIEELELVDLALAELREGRPARLVDVPKGRERDFKNLQLLTSKPVLYVCNVEEDSAATGNSLSAKVAERAAAEGAETVVISARIEEELAQLDESERLEYLQSLGLEEPGLNRVIRSGYRLLNLQTFFTANENEAHAWTTKVGALAPQAAGEVHTDFERGFIRAEVISYDDYVAGNGEHGAKEAGRLRIEGKEYVVQEGDVMFFRSNV